MASGMATASSLWGTLGSLGKDTNVRGVIESLALCPSPPRTIGLSTQKLGQVAEKGLVKPSGDLPESEALGGEGHLLLSPYRRHGLPPQALASHT